MTNGAGSHGQVKKKAAQKSKKADSPKSMAAKRMSATVTTPPKLAK